MVVVGSVVMRTATVVVVMARPWWQQRPRL